MNVFQLLVAAIVTMTLLWVFFAYFAPLFNPPTDVIPQIQAGLRQAKVTPGQALPLGNLVFAENTALTAQGFSEKGTDTIIECNNVEFCCDKTVHCQKKAFWNEKQIVFSQRQTIPTFGRCKLQFDFFACTIFFGQKPPQLELKNLSFEKTVDLKTKTQWIVSGELSNTGKAESAEGIAKLTVSKKGANNAPSIPMGSREQPVKGLAPGEKTPVEFSILVSENGDFEAVLRIESDNAGSIEQQVEFKAINNPNPCRALNQQTTQKFFDAEKKECIEKFFCADCSFAVECKKQWQAIFPQKQFEIGDPSFAQTTQFMTSADECR